VKVFTTRFTFISGSDTFTLTPALHDTGRRSMVYRRRS